MATKLYGISRRDTGEFREALANSAQEACQKLGWMIGDCFIDRVKDVPDDYALYRQRTDAGLYEEDPRD